MTSDELTAAQILLPYLDATRIVVGDKTGKILQIETMDKGIVLDEHDNMFLLNFKFIAASPSVVYAFNGSSSYANVQVSIYVKDTVIFTQENTILRLLDMNKFTEVVEYDIPIIALNLSNLNVIESTNYERIIIV